MTKFQAVLKQYLSAVDRLDEILELPKSEIIRDASIQRFEFTLDTSWKTVKAYLEEFKGLKITSPKDSFREAYRQGLVDYDKVWLEMVDLRNQSSHIYDLKVADMVYGRLPEFYQKFRQLADKLQQFS